jgi:hypothetical protein
MLTGMICAYKPVFGPETIGPQFEVTAVVADAGQVTPCGVAEYCVQVTPTIEG